jgi:sterol desaturase/sphingolipid hydroxylase (fatty acid hydroxylase superfamily)
MTIEQTTQLVQLILNAALMVIAAGVMLAVAILHQMRLEKQRTGTSQRLQRPERKNLRRQARQISRSVFSLNVACLFLVASTGFLALRALVNQSVLISLSLVCFAIGCLVFWVGIGFFLMSVMRRSPSSRSTSGTLGSPLAHARITPLDVSTAPSNLVRLRDRAAR